MSLVEYDVVDSVAVITLNRPGKRNAVNSEMAGALEAAVDRLEGDSGVLVGVLRAAMGDASRPVFCAGHDLSSGAGNDDGTVTERGGFAGIVSRSREKPLIATVDGLATGGGLEIVLACDLVIASERAAFALPEVKWNLVAGGGGLFRLARVIGRPMAMDLALSGTELSAQRAFDLGLVCRLAPSTQIDAAALAFAAEICANGPQAVRLSRRLVAAAEYVNDELAWEMSADISSQILASADLHEGLTAFAERRVARFDGS
jgi:enoyl-CoA hydratase